MALGAAAGGLDGQQYEGSRAEKGERARRIAASRGGGCDGGGGHLEELEVDVHVEGHLAAALNGLLLGGLLGRLGHDEPLRQELLGVARAVELGHARVGLLDEAALEGADAEHGHHAVEQDLRVDVHRRDRLLEVGHEQRVPGLVELPPQGRVVHRAQQRACLGPLVPVRVDDPRQLLHHPVESGVPRDLQRQLLRAGRELGRDALSPSRGESLRGFPEHACSHAQVGSEGACVRGEGEVSWHP